MAVNQLGDGSADGVIVAASGAAVGFYGTTPVAIRATNALHYASVVSATSYMSVTSNLAAFSAEIANTLVGLGIWQ